MRLLRSACNAHLRIFLFAPSCLLRLPGRLAPQRAACAHLAVDERLIDSSAQRSSGV